MRYIVYKVLLDVWTQSKVVLLERVSLQEKQSYNILKRGKESTFLKKLEFMQNGLSTEYFKLILKIGGIPWLQKKICLWIKFVSSMTDMIGQ